MTSQWQGSLATAASVSRQIADRFGPEAAKAYDPARNCFTYRGWRERGYQVKRGEKALISHTFVTIAESVKDGQAETEQKTYRIPRTVYLFCEAQVVKREV